MSPLRPDVLNPGAGKRFLGRLARLRWILAGVLAVAAGCGGGVGSGGTGGYASGPITGFGSVIVGGVRFDDTSAQVQDGIGGSRQRSELRLGMTVEVESGSIVNAAASATRIRFDSELAGPVSGVDLSAGRFTMLGQPVLVDGATVFDDRISGGLSGLAMGRVLEVYAVFDPAAAVYRATRVEPADGGVPLHLRGVVQQLDNAAHTLRIGSTSYSYQGAANVPTTLALGDYVRLTLVQASSSLRWTVSDFGIALAPPSNADEVTLEGLVSSFMSMRSFSINGRPVDASGASFPAGGAMLALGARVAVEGTLRAGVLIASSVTFEDEAQHAMSEFTLIGPITAVDQTGHSIVVRGQTVNLTRSDLRYDGGTAADLTVGRQVEVHGVVSPDRLRIDATRIHFP